MKDLNFNIYALTRPTNQAEYAALLDEAIRMGHELHSMIDEMSRKLAANAASRDAAKSA